MAPSRQIADSKGSLLRNFLELVERNPVPGEDADHALDIISRIFLPCFDFDQFKEFQQSLTLLKYHF